MTQPDPAKLFQRARSIAESALALPDRDRETFITSSCGDDEELRSQVDQLLSNAKTSDSFLAETVLAQSRDATQTVKFNK